MSIDLHALSNEGLSEVKLTRDRLKPRPLNYAQHQ